MRVVADLASGQVKKCSGPCGLVLPLTSFGTRNCDGRRYPVSRCRPCESKRSREAQARALKDGRPYPSYVHGYKRRLQREKESRAAGTETTRWILIDSRRTDKKSGRLNDMTEDSIRAAIGSGCSYCGERDLRMTLDRIDNRQGHTRENVVGACIRCNYLRRNMPHKAWLKLVPGIRAAREEGLFGDWTGRIR